MSAYNCMKAIKFAQCGLVLLCESDDVWQELQQYLPKDLQKDKNGNILFPTGGKLVKHFRGEK